MVHSPQIEWPVGDDEMARRIRAFDWSRTKLGPIEQWPSSLRNALSLVLEHPLPMVLGWGPDLLTFYNSAYRPILGNKPEALGRPFVEVWEETRTIIEPQFAHALAGHSSRVQNAHFVIRRQEWPEDAYFNYSLCPVRDEIGLVKGVLLTTFETSASVTAEAERQRAETALRESEELRRIALDGGRLGTWRWNMREKLIWGDATFLKLWGFPPSNDPLQLVDFSDRISERQRSEMREVITRATQAGEDFDGLLAVASGPTKGHWVRWRGRADQERPWIINGVSFDVTQQELADQKLRESEARLAAAFESVPAGIAVISREGNVVVANHHYWQFLPTGRMPSRDLERLGRWRAWDAQGRLLPPDLYPGARTLQGETVVPGQEMLYTDDNGRELWTNVAAAPTRDDAGDITGCISVITDITTRKAAEAALRESEERLRGFGDASPDVLWIRDAQTLAWTYLTPAFETIYGLPRDEALAGNNFRNWVDLIVREDRAKALEAIRRVRSGERVTFEYRIHHPGGGIRWLRNTDFPIRDVDGHIRAIGGVGHDVTREKQADRTIQTSRQQLRTLVEGVPQLVWRGGASGDWTWSSPQWTAFTGLSNESSAGKGWLVALHPDDRERAMDAWREAGATGKGLEVEYRIREAASGTYRWFQTRALPVRDETSGHILEWLGTSTDIDELRQLQDRQQVLVAELQHRTRNLLGVVRAVAERTAKSNVALDGFLPYFRERLAALSRINSLLSKLEQGERVTFGELIRNELSARGWLDTTSNGRVRLQGPSDVRLRSATVQTFALAIHELTTNAIKYGALADGAGQLTVRWLVKEDDGGKRLHVEWIESGVADIPREGSAPQGGGYGRELIERALPYQLKAKTNYEFGPDGVRCRIEVPLT